MKKRNERGVVVRAEHYYFRVQSSTRDLAVWTFLWGASVAPCITVIDPGLNARVSLGLQEIKKQKIKA